MQFNPEAYLALPPVFGGDFLKNLLVLSYSPPAPPTWGGFLDLP